MTATLVLRRAAVLVAVGCLASAGLARDDARPQPSTSVLHPLFQDHAVLQRDQPIQIWGSVAAGDEVTVSLAGRRKTVAADGSGRWQAMLPAMPEGGPYTLTVGTAGGESATVEDVLLGDVFLCSGQSNMVLQIHRTLNSPGEIQNSANDRLRMLSIDQATSFTPLERFRKPVEWQVASPETVRDWSATCTYFARELQKSIHVPIGMVVAAWGGSNIRPWMSEAALRASGDYDDELDILRLYATDRPAALRRWGELWEGWWRSRTVEPGMTEPWTAQRIDAQDWAAAPNGLGVWESWGVPELAELDGMVWYRTSIWMTAEQAAQPAVLSLGKIDEIDQTWVNGQPVGATSGPGTERLYPLPAGLLRAGENVILVNVVDTWGNGGLYGRPDERGLRLSGETGIPLDGMWRYRIVPRAIGLPPRAPWDSTGGMTTIFNAMIAPLGPSEFRGVVWYQGESNTGEPESYGRLLSGLFADWRARFGPELPFLVVQLANWGRPPTEPAESGWAELREAQRLVVADDPRAGLAVAIDIGNRYDIHPPNKQELGRRLARAARRVIYGESIAASGPLALRARVEGDQVVVEFGDVDGELVAYGAEEPIGFELCGSEPSSCRFAAARIDDQRVLLAMTGARVPERVRFCWADSPVCTLFDGAGLPAGPFELGID